MNGARSWKDRLGQVKRKAPLVELIDRPRIQPKLARLLLALSIAAIFFCGLFPFDLDLTDFSRQFNQRFDWGFSQYFTSGDTIENIFFFMPLGFALAAAVPSIFRNRTKSHLHAPLTIASALIVGLIISSIIELLQCSLLERDPSLTDIVNNTIGTGVGAAIFLPIGDRALSLAALSIERAQRKMGLISLAIVTGLLACAICGVPLLLGVDAGKLTNWNPSFGMALGNEINASRPWDGQVYDIAIAAKAATATQVQSLFAHHSPREVLGESLLAMYDVRGAPPFHDRTGNFPPLDLATIVTTQPFTPATRNLLAPATKPHDAAPAPADALPWPLGEATWLRTASSVGQLSDAITRSGQFTVMFTASSANPQQFEGHRVLTISRGADSRNLTFAQDGDDLVVRVTTGATGRNGDAPEFVVGDVFADNRPRKIIAIFAEAQLRVFVDSLAWQESVRITPTAAIIWALYPRNYWKFRLLGGDVAMVAVIYRAVTFLVLGALAATTVNQMRKTHRERIFVAAAIGFATALILEGLLATIAGNHFSIAHLLSCLIFAAVGIAVIGVRRSLPFAV